MRAGVRKGGYESGSIVPAQGAVVWRRDAWKKPSSGMGTSKVCMYVNLDIW